MNTSCNTLCTNGRDTYHEWNMRESGHCYCEDARLAQIKHMVNRFLGWKLPENFNPDAGITFNPYYNVEWNAKHGRPPAKYEPIGTNLLSATQAEEMVRYLLEGI